MRILFVVSMLLGAVTAQAAQKSCNQGQFGNETYEIKNEKMDDYGRFKSVIQFSKSGALAGEGRYIVSEDGQFAYLETQYQNRVTKLKAVVSIDYQQDGAFMTLCMGKNLKRKGQYDCISCLIREDEQ